jgi:aminomethyltransferase
MANMRRTHLASEHERAGAKMVEFGGWWMPVQFTGIVDEHQAVRSRVGLFDVSHMGEILIRGPGALHVTNYLVTNNVARLVPGMAMYSAMCYPTGGIVDDLLVYCLDNGFLLVVNAANIEKDFEWISKNADGDVHIENQSFDYTQLALQGPRSAEVLGQLTDIDIDAMGFYEFGIGEVAGLQGLVSRTGYTGEDGFEIYIQGQEEDSVTLWRKLLEAGEQFDIRSAGLGARDILRLEMGYCLYGNDITEETTPLEAGLGWVTKLKKGPFIGRDVLMEQKAAGPERRLVGLAVEGRRAPRHGYGIVADGDHVGEVTSGGYSPALQQGIGMGYVSTSALAKEDELSIEIRGNRVTATKVKLPFYKQGSHL